LSRQKLIEGKTDSESYLVSLRRVDVASIERDVFRLGYGKIGLLSQSGETLICNEQDGHWRDGVWRSNDGMDSTPFWMQPPVRSFGARSKALTRLSCDYCDAAPIWLGEQGDYLCDDCSELVSGKGEFAW
jgi:hypothetical protein